MQKKELHSTTNKLKNSYELQSNIYYLWTFHLAQTKLTSNNKAKKILNFTQDNEISINDIGGSSKKNVTCNYSNLIVVWQNFFFRSFFCQAKYLSSCWITSERRLILLLRLWRHIRMASGFNVPDLDEVITEKIIVHQNRKQRSLL